ncbi:concanavalin A-like lectin/glucanase domain-containing protein [Catenaria anguillulae PL171]|uniref:Concanavalin A-like lectin/glucanase domain-containing protein n=1 Tax=Catenaria anguillulae PL171 TaxID=765915 RepID=A0A1Y2HLI7_9FUNG|nr:concanavalin A-like lectin/glucanase domain-containing protein [Catenaria anguillulae PL171]
MHFSHLLATLVLLASASSSATAQTANCFKYGKPCPKEFPFCSGRPNMMTCSSAIWDGYLDNYCTVNASQPNACVEKPMCKDFRVDFNDPNEVPIRTKYEGNPEKQPFIIDTANNVAVKDGSLWLNMRWVGPGGTLARVISTRNFHYGTFSARIRISPGSGLVYTWIFKTAADTDKYGDEIDWEFVPGNSPGFQEAQSNYFLNGDFLNFANGGKHRTPKPLDQWHTYTMKYMPNKVEWLIDDVVVRTIESNATFKTPSATVASSSLFGTLARCPRARGTGRRRLALVQQDGWIRGDQEGVPHARRLGRCQVCRGLLGHQARVGAQGRGWPSQCRIHSHLGRRTD